MHSYNHNSSRDHHHNLHQRRTYPSAPRQIQHNLPAPPPRRRFHFLRTLASGIFQALFTALSLVGFAAVAAFMVMAYTGTNPLQASARQRLVRAAETLGVPSKPIELLPAAPDRHVIYLNREGGVITGGPDNSRRNVSSVVASAGLDEYEVDAFNASPVRWNAIVDCVQDRFEAYDVDVVDQRPVDGPYVMAMVGGRSNDLASRTGHTAQRGARITGLAPLGPNPIDDAVVFVFSREVNHQTRGVCESIVHEVGHAYGLDHVMDCHDPMAHLASCGQREFQDEAIQCGENEARECVHSSATQNSHQQLLELLGPATDGSEDTEGGPAANQRIANQSGPLPQPRS